MEQIKLVLLPDFEGLAIWEHEGKYAVATGNKYPFIEPPHTHDIEQVGGGGVKWFTNYEEALEEFNKYVTVERGGMVRIRLLEDVKLTDKLKEICQKVQFNVQPEHMTLNDLVKLLHILTEVEFEFFE